MPPETPVQCEHCGNDQLLHGADLKLGTLNNMLANIGGPGQVPPTMGNQWAVYLCPRCGAIFPYRKHYATQPQLQAQYEKIVKLCKERMNRQKNLEELGEKLEGILESFKVTSALPGGPGSNEDQQSMQHELTEIRKELAEMRAEIKRRRGGRPKGSKTTTKKQE